MRRVVVTGMGLVTPLADGVEETWSRLLSGRSGAGPITLFDASALATTYACEVPLGDGTDGTFHADKYMAPKDARKVDEFILFGIAAAQQAVEMSGYVGGAEAAICEVGIAGFNACKALSTKRADDPQKASRPYDADRDGFVMGEGAGAVVLEEYEHAVARGATIYAEVLGYGLSGDAYHITAPSENGEGGERSMRMALDDAGLAPADIDYINAHGTSTMADTIELGAVERMMGDAAGSVTMSSTKSATGHLLGAAGAIEAIFSILAIRDQVAPPTINLDTPAVETVVDLAPNAKREREINVALSNSFGFGGTNASVLFGKVS